MNDVSSENRHYNLKARADAQRETRRRIVEATIGLHAEVGPARTTVAEIARRAGVQRLTVYNHFPDDAELMAACQADWLALNPLPDLAATLALPVAMDAVRETLVALYGWYRRTRDMTGNVQRDRVTVPALDAVLREGSDTQLNALADALAARMAVNGGVGKAASALCALAVSFWTWSTFDDRGLSDAEGADIMAQAIGAGAVRDDAVA